MKNLLLPLFLVISFQGISQKTPFTSQDILALRNFSYSEITTDGMWVAGKIQTRLDRLNIDHSRFGDPGYIAPATSQLVVVNSETSEMKVITSGTVTGDYSWSPDNRNLAYILYEGGSFHLNIFEIERARNRRVKLKTDLHVSSDAELVWTPDGKSLVLMLRDENWQRRADSLYNEATSGPVTVYDSQRPFLKWEEIRNQSGMGILSKVDISDGTVQKIAPEGIYGNFVMEKEGTRMSWMLEVPRKTVYDRKEGIYYTLLSADLSKQGPTDTLIRRTTKQLRPVWDRTGSSFAYADSSKIFVGTLGGEIRKVSPDTTEIVKKDTLDVMWQFMQWSPDAKAVLASSRSGYWIIDIETTATRKVYDLPEDPELSPETRIISWTEDGSSWYMSYSAKDRWERGLVRYDIESKSTTTIFRDEKLYQQWRVSENGNMFFYLYSDGDQPGDLYVSPAGSEEKKRLTELNPWIENRKITKSELIEYRDADGEKLYGVLYYPVDYEEGKKYPLVCEIYESFFDNGFNTSMNIIANQGYFGFRPSVNLEQGYPGEAWIKGVTSGINKLIEMKLVDEEKLGVHGTSYGGYATSLLIAQTDRFAAAINISGKTNIISFLGDSPKIGTRNYAAAEVGQDRIGETLWQAPMKYMATSAVLFADRINTPHLLLTGEHDWNVPALNTRELYYALRRLGKEVVWVNYQNGGHGAGWSSTEADYHDQWSRILEWYSEHFEKTDEKK